MFFVLFSVLALASARSNNLDENSVQTHDYPPFIASLKRTSLYNDQVHHFCSGSILGKYWILTAGHCFTGSIRELPVTSYAEVGSEYLKSTNATAYKISEFYLHPNQSESIQIFRNDLCLVKLEKPIEFTKKVQPIKLGKIQDQDEVPVLASGWGRVSQYGHLNSKLRFVDLKTMKYEQCQKIHKRKHNLVDRENQICGYGGVGNTLCFGDSGGPLVDVRSGYLVGVFSSLEDCSGEYPVLFMKVERYIDWINQVTKLNLTLN